MLAHAISLQSRLPADWFAALDSHKCEEWLIRHNRDHNSFDLYRNDDPPQTWHRYAILFDAAAIAFAKLPAERRAELLSTPLPSAR